jgi:SAM-dependent methyltransferase
MSTGPIQSARAYWDAAAGNYDQIFPDKVTGKAQRDTVWRELERIFHPAQRVLELNCGTGIDALHLAKRGVNVLALDLSPRMVEAAGRRAASSPARHLLEFRVLPTEQLAALRAEGPFDGAFSNFSGLNCVEDLSATARNLAELVKPGGHLLICVVGRWVPWEVAWHLAHANAGKAARRFRRTTVSYDGRVRVYHRTVAATTRAFAPDFRLRRRRGIGVVMPTGHYESWAVRFPNAFQALARADRRVGGWPLLRRMGDCALLTFERVTR